MKSSWRPPHKHSNGLIAFIINNEAAVLQERMSFMRLTSLYIQNVYISNLNTASKIHYMHTQSHAMQQPSLSVPNAISLKPNQTHLPRSAP